nr:MAG TPA: hypothetical protein [Caudoviricetes sp.]
MAAMAAPRPPPKNPTSSLETPWPASPMARKARPVSAMAPPRQSAETPANLIPARLPRRTSPPGPTRSRRRPRRSAAPSRRSTARGPRPTPRGPRSRGRTSWRRCRPRGSARWGRRGRWGRRTPWRRSCGPRRWCRAPSRARRGGRSRSSWLVPFCFLL